MASSIPALQKFVLRPFQKFALNESVRWYDEGTNRLMIVMATGLGKTVVFAKAPEFFPDQAKHGMLVLVHRKELITQAVHKIKSSNPKLVVGVEQASRKALKSCDVVVASVQTLGRKGGTRINKFEDMFGVIVVDEAHHVKEGGGYAEVLNYFGVGDDPTRSDLLPSGKRRVLLGVTATPNRSDGLGLHKFFSEIVVNYNITWGVKNGYLTDVKAWTFQTGTDISSVKTKAGDFDQSGLSSLVNNTNRNNQIVSAWKQYSGKRALVFAASVEHAHELAAVFIAAGVGAAAIDGTTPQDVREGYYEQLKTGEIMVLTNFGVLTEGFDAPWIETILMARPTKSTPLYTQMMGRGTRPLPSVDLSSHDVDERVNAILDSDKPFMTVIDFVDNVGRHDIVTAPSLVGMTPSFDAKGGRLIKDVYDEIQRLEKENPFANLRDAGDFEEIEVRLQSVNVWDMTRMDEVVSEHSDFRWFQSRPDELQIEIPANTRDADDFPDPDDRRRMYVVIGSDTLGRSTASVVYPPAWIDGRHHPEKVIMSTSTKENWKDAVSATDEWVKSNFKDVSGLMEHTPKWGTGLATSGQIDLLNKMKVPLIMKEGKYIDIDTGKALTKGKASALITAQKVLKRTR